MWTNLDTDIWRKQLPPEPQKQNGGGGGRTQEPTFHCISGVPQEVLEHQTGAPMSDLVLDEVPCSIGACTAGMKFAYTSWATQLGPTEGVLKLLSGTPHWSPSSQRAVLPGAGIGKGGSTWQVLGYLRRCWGWNQGRILYYGDWNGRKMLEFIASCCCIWRPRSWKQEVSHFPLLHFSVSCQDLPLARPYWKLADYKKLKCNLWGIGNLQYIQEDKTEMKAKGKRKWLAYLRPSLPFFL